MRYAPFRDVVDGWAMFASPTILVLPANSPFKIEAGLTRPGAQAASEGRFVDLRAGAPDQGNHPPIAHGE